MTFSFLSKTQPQFNNKLIHEDVVSHSTNYVQLQLHDFAVLIEALFLVGFSLILITRVQISYVICHEYIYISNSYLSLKNVKKKISSEFSKRKKTIIRVLASFPRQKR